MHPSRPISALLALLLLTAGCATQQTAWKPTLDTYGDANAHRIPQDEAECRELALQASGNTAAEAGKGAVVGGAIGAASGAAIGAVTGNAGRGAALGAAIGGTGGALRQGSGSHEEYKQAFRNCMRNRGHKVIN